ncbi:MAG TPA: hypothetical protein VNP73_01665 [Actinomycetota bacterium]|nr:hypothetical protein [Actinomycetota bacterium]
MRRTVALALLALVAAACVGEPDPNLTESGKGKPQVTALMPNEAEPGSTVTAAVRIANPGPGDMESVVVAFSRIGNAGLPAPIVDVGTGGRTDGVKSVRPEPVAVSQDAVVYRFGGLPEGEALEIRFELVLPENEEGEVGNAILVYDGAEPDRAKGTRLSTFL